MLHGWKARIHHLTRNRSFLIRTSLIILVSGFAAGCLIQWVRVAGGPASKHGVSVNPLIEGYRDAWRKLERAEDPQPRQLLVWLRHFLSKREELADETGMTKPDVVAFEKDGRLLGFDVRSMVEKHTQDGEERQLFVDFVAAGLRDEAGKASDVGRRIREAAGRKPTPPFANEMLAHLLLGDGHEADALEALLREGAFEDARAARESALRLAIEHKNEELLRDLMEQPLWLGAASSWMRSRIGGITGDVWLQLQGIVAHQIETTRWGVLMLTLFTAGLWYVIFVIHSERGSWRWTRPILPVVAGVCSVWPTLIILTWQEHHLGMTADAPFPHDLWYYLAGVGLREELSKLALASIFMPWLVWRRSEGLALLTGAFVGLGFAMEENIQYYGGGGAIAWTRFLTANFMHASMTGITTHALYEMLRTRFGHAERLVGAFVAVVAAHGLYDFVSVSDHEVSQFLGISIFSIIILAFLARHFFDLMASTTQVAAGIVSAASVFLLGSSFLIAVLFVLAGLETDDIAGIAAVGSECAGVAPVAYIFWKKFEVR